MGPKEATNSTTAGSRERARPEGSDELHHRREQGANNGRRDTEEGLWIDPWPRGGAWRRRARAGRRSRAGVPKC